MQEESLHNFRSRKILNFAKYSENPQTFSGLMKENKENIFQWIIKPVIKNLSYLFFFFFFLIIFLKKYYKFLGQIHNPSSYVRDFYFFKRSQYPQLELVHMKPEDAFNGLQRQELIQKFVEIGKVLLTWAILKNVDMVGF